VNPSRDLKAQQLYNTIQDIELHASIDFDMYLLESWDSCNCYTEKSDSM